MHELFCVYIKCVSAVAPMQQQPIVCASVEINISTSNHLLLYFHSHFLPRTCTHETFTKRVIDNLPKINKTRPQTSNLHLYRDDASAAALFTHYTIFYYSVFSALIVAHTNHPLPLFLSIHFCYELFLSLRVFRTWELMESRR